MSDIVQELSDEENEYIPRIGGEAEFDFSVNDESPFVVVPRGVRKKLDEVVTKWRPEQERILSMRD